MSNLPSDPARPERAPNISDLEETAPARTLRPGDSMFTELDRWELVTYSAVAEASDPPRWEIFTATPRSGQAWLLPPDREVRILRGDLRHPSWCSPQHCGALNPAASYHWSPPVVAEAHALTGWKITAQVWKASDEPLDEGRAALFLVLEEQVPVIGSRFVLDLDDVQAVEFHAALGPLVAVLAHQAASRGAA